MWPKFKLFNKTKPISDTKTRVVTIGGDSFLAQAILGTGNLKASDAMRYYRDNTAVATSVDLIAESIEQIKPVLKNDNGEYVESSQLLDHLGNPNGFETWQEFVGQVARHYLLTADSELFSIGTVTRPPIQTFALKPQNVSITEDARDGYPASYIVASGLGGGAYVRDEQVGNITRFYDGSLKELYHIMGFSSNGNNISGDSKLSAASMDIKQQLAGRIHNLKMINSGGRPSLVFSFNDEDRIDDDEHRERKRRLNEDLAGEQNAGRIAVLSGADVTVKDFGTSNKDMDYSEPDKVSSFAIYNRYKIPLPLVDNSAATMANRESSMLALYDLAVLPLADLLFANLQKMMFPRYKIEGMSLTYDRGAIPALMIRRLDELKKRKEIGVETVNELRGFLPEREDYNGGDELYMPANLIPLGSDMISGGIDDL